MLTSAISDMTASGLNTLPLLKIVKRRKRSRTLLELDDAARKRLSELEETITSQLGNGAFFLVGMKSFILF